VPFVNIQPGDLVKRFFVLCIAIVLTSSLYAQLCNGSLGDPVVNITFGTYSNTGGANNYVPKSGYTYIDNSCPNDGYYTITNYSSACYGNTWFTINDHTGDGGGNYMLVNASFDPGDFFLTTVTDLCPNTTYEFAAWVMNVMKPLQSIKPNLTFRIEQPDGKILGFYNTGDLNVTPGPEWKQYGFFFTTPPANATVVLRITNSAPGGYGNDLALDDITFRPCGSLITAHITNNPTDTINICEGNTSIYNFMASAPGYISPVYHWQVSKDSGATWNDIPGASTLAYQRLPTTAGRYWYRMTVAEASVAGIASCRIASTAVVINVHPKPLVDAGPDRIILTGGNATLNARVEGENIKFLWSPNSYINNDTDMHPVVSPLAETKYTLSAISAFGCMNEDNVLVKVVTGIYVPTAFTPNSDGKNDTWTIPFLDPAFEATVNVFNRWGQLVYHTVASNVSWDGRIRGQPQPSGIYVYLITFKTYDLQLRGTVTLIR
jgi:gliding motility-associated-like protein